MVQTLAFLLVNSGQVFVSKFDFIDKNLAAQEAIATGDPELVKLILVHRDAQIVRHQAVIVADLLQKLRETPDFYIEMKWEFTSWRKLLYYHHIINFAETVEVLCIVYICIG